MRYGSKIIDSGFSIDGFKRDQSYPGFNGRFVKRPYPEWKRTFRIEIIYCPVANTKLKRERRMSPLTREIEEHYRQGIERERLSAHEGELERLRTQSILTRFLPPPPAVVLDIGGGTGIYAVALAQIGYSVHLMDPVELHLEQARSHSHESGVRLASISPGNACKLDFASGVQIRFFYLARSIIS